MKTLINKLKTLLRKEDELDLRELHYEFEFISQAFETKMDCECENKEYEEIEEAAIFYGLQSVFERIHPKWYRRDVYSKLAIANTQDLNFEVYYPEVDAEIPNVQSEITHYIVNRVDNGPENCIGDKYFMLIKKNPAVNIPEETLNAIRIYLHEISVNIIRYIEENKPRGWNWREDLHLFCYFVFTHLVETSYRAINGEGDSIECYLYKAFTFYEPNVPEWMQNAIYASYNNLEDILDDISNYIEKHNYYAMDYEAWFRPVLVDIGLIGARFALEQKEKKD